MTSEPAPDLFALPVVGERCVKPQLPHLKAMFDPHPLDSAQTLRNKWCLRLTFQYSAGCLTNGPTCERCRLNFLRQLRNPEWPWVK